MSALASYLTHTNDGLSVNLQGFMGGNVTLWNPATATYEDHYFSLEQIQCCFDDTAYVEGVPNQKLSADRKPHYVYAFINGAGQKKANFSRSGFTGATPRYGFNPFGPATFADGQGNINTLWGMVCPVDGKIGNILGAANARILCSSSPFSHCPQQFLPANSGQRGGTFNAAWSSWAALPEINSELGIYSCHWAWRSIIDGYKGRIADSSVGSPSTVFLQAHAKNLETGGISYGPQIIHQFPYVGANMAIDIPGVNLALDDGAYYYSLHGAVSGQAAHLQVEHVLDGWI